MAVPEQRWAQPRERWVHWLAYCRRGALKLFCRAAQRWKWNWTAICDLRLRNWGEYVRVALQNRDREGAALEPENLDCRVTYPDATYPDVISPDIIRDAARVTRPHLRRTPVVHCDGADFGLPGVPLTFKLELLQHSGSFKARGAIFNLLSRSIPAAGVAAASGGNHGAAVAWAAQKVGVAASIFVPVVSSHAKIERIRSYGAQLTVTGDRYADSLAACDRWAAETGALTVHAFNQPETLAGQGTLGLELEEQAPDIDTLLVAVGGGGLIGGIAAWYCGRVKIIAVEPELCPTLFMAMQAGRPVDAPSGGVAADSLAPLRVGEIMFPLARKWVERTVLVPDSAIEDAQARLWDVLRVVAEPGGATAMAALLSGAYRPEAGETVGLLVCGGNTNAVQFRPG